MRADDPAIADLFGIGARSTVKLTQAEFRMHCVIAGIIERFYLPEWRYTHLPFGEKRPPATAARLKRMGTKPGWPDFMLIGPGRTCFLELKTRVGRMSREQTDIATHLMRCGCGYAMVRTVDDAVDCLKAWGVIPVTVAVQ